jgi:hypothetical protein
MGRIRANVATQFAKYAAPSAGHAEDSTGQGEDFISSTLSAATVGAILPREEGGTSGVALSGGAGRRHGDD